MPDDCYYKVGDRVHNPELRSLISGLPRCECSPGEQKAEDNFIYTRGVVTAVDDWICITWENFPNSVFIYALHTQYWEIYVPEREEIHDLVGYDS